MDKPVQIRASFTEPRRPEWRWSLIMCGMMILGYLLTFGLAEVAKLTDIQSLDDVGGFLFHGGALTGKVFSGQVWRLVTHAFLHGGMFHLVGNLVMFFIFAANVNYTFWRRQWIIIFLGSAVLGGLLTLLFDGRVLVGASIGIMGLVGAQLAAEIRKLRIPLTMLPAAQLTSVKAMLVLLAMQFGLEMLVPNVGHVGHLSGVVCGFLIGMLLPLCSGERLIVSRPGIVQVDQVEWRTRHLPRSIRGKRKDQVVDDVVLTLTPEFDPKKDFLVFFAMAFDYRGRLIPTWNYVAVVAGKFNPACTEGALLATRFKVEGYTLTEQDAEELSREDEKERETAKPPRAVVLTVRALGLLLAYLLYLWWSPSLLWDDAQLQWLNFLPGPLAPLAISIARVSGAVVVSFFTSLMFTNLFLSIGWSIIQLFRKHWREHDEKAS